MRRSRFPLYTVMGLVLFLYIPLVIVMANSFNLSRYGGQWGGFTLKWYSKLFSDRTIWYAFRNSLIIAFSSTATSMVLGTTAAIALYRFKTRFQNLHRLFIHLPLVMPDILVGISLLLFFVALKVKLGLFTIFLAHVTFCISYVAMVVLGRLQDFNYAVIEAAMDLGASWFTAVRRVMIPMLAPGIMAGGLLAFTLSIDDFVITFFVSGPGSATLPLYIYSMIRHGSPMVINALTGIFLVFTFSVVILSKKLLEEK
ncbi:MAG TPA: ABC transporter permease [Spirochaetota bacterium]|nr:ABC transporter permease [Spirochaetota bacterium]HPR49848.1 ABC transporter permease [Spirochaetota bacterium]